MDMNPPQQLGDPEQVRIQVDRLHDMIEGRPEWELILINAATQVEQIVTHWRQAGISDLIIGCVVSTVIREQTKGMALPWAQGEDAALVLALDALQRQSPPVSEDVLDGFLN